MENSTVNLETIEMTPAEMEQAAAGSVFDCFDDLESWIACGFGHDYVFTGEEKEDSFCIFWSRHKKLYRCRRCGHEDWRHED